MTHTCSIARVVYCDDEANCNGHVVRCSQPATVQIHDSIVDEIGPYRQYACDEHADQVVLVEDPPGWELKEAT